MSTAVYLTFRCVACSVPVCASGPDTFAAPETREQIEARRCTACFRLTKGGKTNVA